MKGLFLYSVIVLTVFCLNFSACSKKEDIEMEKEKGKIEKMTDQVADDAVKGINSAINKAKALQKKADENIKVLEETSSE